MRVKLVTQKLPENGDSSVDIVASPILSIFGLVFWATSNWDDDDDDDDDGDDDDDDDDDDKDQGWWMPNA